jgi:magnesium transporter
MVLAPACSIHSESAGPHLVDLVPRGCRTDRAEVVRTRLTGGDFDAVETLYVIDEHGRLEGRFLGVVPPTALITILRREPIEDLNILAGLRHDHLRSLRAMTEAPVRRARERLPWLLVGLMGSCLAPWVVSRYGNTLSREVMVAFFMPAIVYLADAIGTQSEAIAVRGFSRNHVPLRRSIVAEIKTGFLIGSILGLLSIPFVLIGFGSQRLALAVALSIFAAGGVATSIGILLPWALERTGRDPAFGSGPVATILQDLLSLLIYLLIVQLLGGVMGGRNEAQWIA